MGKPWHPWVSSAGWAILGMRSGAYPAGVGPDCDAAGVVGRGTGAEIVAPPPPGGSDGAGFSVQVPVAFLASSLSHSPAPHPPMKPLCPSPARRARKSEPAEARRLRRVPAEGPGAGIRFAPGAAAGLEPRLLRPIVQAAEERQRKAGLDLHEGLSQQLAGLALLAGALSARLGRGQSEEAGAALEIARELGVAVQSARELALGLYPVDAMHGGAVLDQVVGRVCRERGIQCEIYHEGVEPEWEEAERIQVCRIVEEAIGQAVRERGAGRVVVELRAGAGGFVLSVTDDGKGNRMRGDCRLLLACRARLLGARMRVRKGPGCGLEVSFRRECA